MKGIAARMYRKDQSSDILDGEARHGYSVRVGKAILMWCHNQGCWMLPAGPQQRDRKIKSSGAALRFARNMSLEMMGVKVNG